VQKRAVIITNWTINQGELTHAILGSEQFGALICARAEYPMRSGAKRVARRETTIMRG